MTATPTAAFAAYLVSLLVAHTVADHWVQSQRAASRCRLHSRPGGAGCVVVVTAHLVHVATYAAALAGFGVLAWVLLDLGLSPLGFVISHVGSGVIYCWADRRRPFGFVRSRGDRRNRVYFPRFSTGEYAADQSAHWTWLFVAALLTVGLP